MFVRRIRKSRNLNSSQSLSLRIETKTLCAATILLCRYRYYSFYIYYVYRAFPGGIIIIIFFSKRLQTTAESSLCRPTISVRLNFTGDGSKLLFRTRLVQRFIIISYHLPSTDHGKAAAETTSQIPHDRRFDNT